MPLKTIQSTAAGLSADRFFMSPGAHNLFVSAPDWDGGKKATVYASYEDVDGSYRKVEAPDGSPLECTENRVVCISGVVWLAIYLENPGTGARMDFLKSSDTW